MKRIPPKRRTRSAPDKTDKKGHLLHAVNGAAEILLTAGEDNFENSLQEGMELVARCIDIDRIYIWQNKMEAGCLKYIQQFEWLGGSGSGGETVQPKTGFSYSESIPEWESKLLKGECVNGPISGLSHIERTRLEPYGIKSILVVPVYLQDIFWGFVSFDDCHQERAFTGDEVDILRSASLMIASAVDRNETVARMREADEHVKLMLDATPLCCSLWNRKLDLIDCNAEVVNFFGLKDKREYLDSFFALSPEYQPDGRSSAEKALENIRAAFLDGGSVFEWMHQMPDGSPMPAEVTLVRVRRGDEFIVAGYTRDLREHKKMIKDIQNAVERAQAASEAKSAFLAQMNHEIRTPMNVIAGMTELMLRENIPASIYEHVMSIKQASGNMLSLINDILDFSKIEAGSLDIVPSEYSLTSLINNVLIIIRMKVSEKPILFTANIDCDIPNRLIGDETRIRQILLNVLDNAVKYTIEGFISLTVTGEVKDDTVVLTAEVSDSGIGIKKEDMDRLFDDFIRVDGEMNKNVQGTGLGLAITKSLCQAMGGSIGLRSEYGVGSTFIIKIPQKIKSHDEKFASISDPDEKRVLLYETRPAYADSITRSLDNLGVFCTLVKTQKEFYEKLKRQSYPFVFTSLLLSESAGQIIEELKADTVLVLLTEFGEAPSMHNAHTVAMPAHAASIANILDGIEDNIFYNASGRENARFIAPSACILVVDDLNTNLKVARGLMLPYQMQVDVCGSGEESVECVRRKRYDIIFMDHMMPEIDGVEAAGRIRSIEDESGYYKSVPIIALAANAVSGVKEMFLQSGMNDFLAKPIDVIKLHGLLEKWIPREKKEKPGNIREKSPPADINPVQIQIEGVDVQAGTVIAGGTSGSYLKTLDLFHADGLDKINKIRDCIEKNDIKLYTICVHALKSAAANIGAREISDLFKILEMAGERDDSRFILENTEHSLEKLETLLENIHDALSKNQDEPKKDNDPARLKNELLKLREALNNRDAGEIDDVMSALKSLKWNQPAGDMFKELSRNIFLINYVGASALVDKLLMC